MPKIEIDYSNTIIYKITCNDPNVTDSYVGHTTNFVQRKYAHKNGVTNEKSPCYNLKLYRTIRDNGGWDSWKMEMVQFYNCKNIYEAKIKEQEHYTELKASLNSIEPMKPKEAAINDIEIQQDIDSPSEDCEVSELNYNCEKCKYKCNNKKDFNKHLITKKHNKTPELSQNISKTYVCKTCNNSYIHQSSLSKHANNCKPQVPLSQQQEPSDIAKLAMAVMEVAKINYEIQKTLTEFYKNKCEMVDR